MDKLKPPHELKIAGGNLADRWEKFLERFRWYLAAVGEDGSEDKKKVAILLTVAGAEAQEVFRTFTYEPAKPAKSKCWTRRVQVVGVDNDSTGDEGGFFVSAIHNNTQQCEWIALLTVCNSLVPLKVDSGAQVIIPSLSDYGGLARTCKIHLRQNYVPSVYPARKVTQSQKLKKELDRLVQTEVLVKAERPTEWVLPLVIGEKPNGDLRFVRVRQQ
ncbi:hypothetical protein NP493_806g01022 [Ridgeia piscesae]|uniref:Uncharacterized protein n=1 Tax=Ridgeia piscesae TaxID=27915 RepID=A0AAD9KNJ7_RIDPI|nr:hypothetical protein NP493_806g01022 [Ridgeia piscesae]